jgi:small neutral amino acid transporter SnatA (MarC family)
VGVVTVVFVVALCVYVSLSLSLSLSRVLEELGVCGLFVLQGIEEWQLCPE